MPMLSIFVDDATMARLTRLQRETGRTPEDMAECAVAESALAEFRHRDDPGKKVKQ